MTTGATVRAAFLSQELAELPGAVRVLEAVEEVARRVNLGDRELSAGQLAEVFGFTERRLWTPVSDLSGGERRRLQLLRLLAGEPNVLLLDEPTNDLDTDTLASLEDLLDTGPARWSSRRTTGTSWSGSATRSTACTATAASPTFPAESTTTSPVFPVDHDAWVMIERRRDPASTHDRPRCGGAGELRAAKKELARLDGRSPSSSSGRRSYTGSWRRTLPTTRR